MSEQWYDWLVVFEKVKSIVSKVMPRHIATIWRGFIIIINFFSFSQYRIEVAVCIHGSEPIKNVKYVKFHPFGAPKNPLCHFSTVQDVSCWLSTFKIFSGCKGLISATIGNGVTTIGDGAFEYCSELTSVTIGNKVTYIGDLTFNSCKRLNSVTSLNPTPPSIGSKTFSDYYATLKVPIGSKSAYKSFRYWMNFTNIVEIDPTGVQTIKLDKDINVPMYNLNGRKLKEPSKGINIIGDKQ